MAKKRNVVFKTMALLSILMILTACALKRVRLYYTPDTVGGDIVRAALGLQGKPYRNGAKGPDAFDCSGLVYYVFKLSHIELPPPAEAQGRAGYEKGRFAVEAGDLVLFKIDKDLHIGIMINGNDFVHASRSRGVAVDGVDAAYWQKYLVGFRSVL
jgi:cell wall-associated NlpC family hydrolase